MNSIANGDMRIIVEICEALNQYKHIYYSQLVNGIVSIIGESVLISHLTEYQEIIAERPVIDDED